MAELRHWKRKTYLLEQLTLTDTHNGYFTHTKYTTFENSFFFALEMFSPSFRGTPLGLPFREK